MKFSNLLKSNMVRDLEGSYLQYDLIKSCIKLDKYKFQELIESNFKKISEYYFSIKSQTEFQKNKLFDYLSENLEYKKILESIKKKKKRSKKTSSISDFSEVEYEDSFSEDERSSVRTMRSKECGNESHASHTGVESDVENLEGGFSEDTANESTSSLEGNGKYRYPDKKKGFIFSSFDIASTFERRRKEKAFHELVQAITFIVRYKDLNYLGISILISKYKRYYPNDPYPGDFLRKVHGSAFYRSKSATKMKKNIKRVYKRIFAVNDEDRTKYVFSHIGKRSKVNPLNTFLLGILLTISCGLLYFTEYEDKAKCVKNVVYSLGICHFGALLFGCCLITFDNYHINYNLIFNFDVASNLDSVKYELTISCCIFFEFLTAFLIGNAFPKFTAYFIFFANVFIIFCPCDILFYRSRLYLIGVIPGMIGSIYKRVFFKNFFFADVCQSFTKCFLLIYFSFLPRSYWAKVIILNFFGLIRLIQCYKRYNDTKKWLPHLMNMMKYLVVGFQIVISSSVWTEKSTVQQYFLFIVSLIASSFTLFWDFTFDWSINRTRKVFPKYFYFCAAVYNIGARFIWTTRKFIFLNEYTLILIEVIRRFIWTLFRVENEHINNCRVGKSSMDMLFSNELFYKKDTEKQQVPQEENEIVV